MKEKILISACLVGINSRYNGKSNKIEPLVELVKQGKAIFMCPEQTGGLSTPREPAEIEAGKTAKDVLAGKGRVLTISGMDVTKEFLNGAHTTLSLCKEAGVTKAILKARSPSCGSTEVYDGTHSGVRIPGSGITAELLRQNGIKVFDEERYQI